MSNDNRTSKTQKRFLAYLFYDKKFIASSLGRVSSQHLSEYHAIYGLLTGYYQRFKDVITDEAIDIMFSKKNADANVISSYKTTIIELRNMLKDGHDNFIGNDAEFNMLLEELEEHKKRRDYVSIAESIVNFNPLDCSSEQLEKLEQEVNQNITQINSRKGAVRKEGTLKDSAKERLESYNLVKNNPQSLKAVPTGFSKIDDANGGFRAGELIYVIGRKGDGKSVALLNFAHNAWVAGHNVIIFTLEISKEDYERRFDARAAGVSSNGLKMGKFEEAEEDIYFKYIKNLEKNKIEALNKETGNVELVEPGILYTVDCPQGCTPAFIESKLDTVEQLLGIKFDVVVTDYAGIMRPNVSIAEKRHEQGQIALDQKRIARERECVVISASQMSRAGKDQKEVDSSAVSESDQVADHIDWGIAVRSVSDTTGVMSSFKTRDAAPFTFHFTKKYSQMKMIELEDSLASWDSLEGM